MFLRVSKRWLLPPGLVAGLLLLLASEAALALRGEGSPEAPGSPDEVVGASGDRLLTLAILGDSTGSGVGAVSQDQGYPRRLARRLAERLHRRVDLHVYAVSGARVRDVLLDQIPRLGDLQPDLILLAIGGNDVVHLTLPGRARRDLSTVLDHLAQYKVPVVVSGVPAMGTVTRAAQPLRMVAGAIAGAVYDPIWRAETERRGMTRVDLAAITGPVFARDHSMLAPDGFHPGPSGYEVWADAFFPALEKAIATPT